MCRNDANYPLHCVVRNRERFFARPYRQATILVLDFEFSKLIESPPMEFYWKYRFTRGRSHADCNTIRFIHLLFPYEE